MVHRLFRFAFVTGIVHGIAFANVITPAMAGVLFGADSETNQLIRINPGTGAGTAVGPFGYESVQGLAFDASGTLYGTDRIANALLRINTQTGAATLIGAHGFDGISGLAFDPTTGVLYGSDSDTSQLVTIDTSTGAASAVGPIGFDSVQGLEFAGGRSLFGVDRNRNLLLVIDTTTGAGTGIGGLPGFNGLSSLAFDPVQKILWCTDIATDQLINTSTGAPSVIGPLGFDEVTGLAFTNVPEAATLGMGLYGLLLFACGNRLRRS